MTVNKLHKVFLFIASLLYSLNIFSQSADVVPKEIIEKEYRIHFLVDSVGKQISFHRVDSSLLHDQKGFLVGKFYDTIFYDKSERPIKFVTTKIVLNSSFSPRINKYECYFLPYNLNRVEYSPLSISLQESLPSTLLFFENDSLFITRGLYKNRNVAAEETILKEIKKYYLTKHKH